MITRFNENTLLTLGLKKGDKYTNAGRFLADENDFNFGIDIVKFGKNQSEIIRRERLTNQSLLKQYDKGMALFEEYYHDYEEVTGAYRVSRVRLPQEAFRESLANSIVHRDYSIKANIQIEFWDNHICVTSPGGLTDGMAEETYLNGGLSVPRNETIANIFYRLNIIETFGTGINRIIESYSEYRQKPTFVIEGNVIRTVLPIIDYSKKSLFSEREQIVWNSLKKGTKTRKELQERLGTGDSVTKELLNELVKQGKIERIGKGPSTKYRML